MAYTLARGAPISTETNLFFGRKAPSYLKRRYEGKNENGDCVEIFPWILKAHAGVRIVNMDFHLMGANLITHQ